MTKREELKIYGVIDLVSTNHLWITLHRDVVALGINYCHKSLVISLLNIEINIF